MKFTSYLLTITALFGAAQSTSYKQFEGYSELSETIFVFEMIRHGSRASNGNVKSPKVPKGFFGEGIGNGILTADGKIQHLRNGLNRRSEYIVNKKFLSEKYDPEEIVGYSTYKQRCAVSGKFYLHGMYPMQEVDYNQEVEPHLADNSPFRGTSYDVMMNLMHNPNDKKPVCEAGPIMQMPPKSDIMMHTRNCKTVHDFLNKDQFDMVQLEKDMRQVFGSDYIDETQKKLVKYFENEHE